MKILSFGLFLGNTYSLLLHLSLCLEMIYMFGNIYKQSPYMLLLRSYGYMFGIAVETFGLLVLMTEYCFRMRIVIFVSIKEKDFQEYSCEDLHQGSVPRKKAMVIWKQGKELNLKSRNSAK